MTDARKAEVERLALEGLRGVAPDLPLWKTVLLLLEVFEHSEVNGAITPGLDDANRHYAAGRLAMLRDLQEMLPEMRAKINAPPPKQ